MNTVVAQAEVSPVANTLGGQGWRQAGELGGGAAAIGGRRAAAGGGRRVLAALTTGIYFVVTLVMPIARHRLPLGMPGTSTLRVRYPEGQGILRTVLNEAARRGFATDHLAADD
jgi:putative Mg2+ transporter-C (MgtC) family protein